MTSLGSLRARYLALARRLGAPGRHVRLATRPTQDGGAHVELDGDRWRYLVTERGRELERRETDDLDLVLYWLVSDLTRAMASDHEMAHREAGVDVRRLLFAKHVELLRSLSPAWATRKETEYERVLREHPFVDEDPAERPHRASFPETGSSDGLPRGRPTP